jgi:hypothetical protein
LCEKTKTFETQRNRGNGGLKKQEGLKKVEEVVASILTSMSNAENISSSASSLPLCFKGFPKCYRAEY